MIILAVLVAIIVLGSGAWANFGMVQAVNNSIPPGGYLLDGSGGFLYQNTVGASAGTGKLLAR